MMVDLILRPSTLAPDRPWALQLRWHESVGPTEYYTIARVSDHIADEIIRAGRSSYLFDDKSPEGIDLKQTITALEAENASLQAQLAGSRTTPPVGEMVVTLDRKLGGAGAAYDPPGPQRAYTYQHQPHNGPAYNLGCAVAATRNSTSGDAIDVGLILLRELEARGFGVFEITPCTALNLAEGSSDAE